MATHYQGSPEESAVLDAYVKLTRAANSVQRKLTPTIANSGLTMTQFGVLEALHHVGPMCQRELADKLFLTPGNLTLVISNLEKQGLVVKLRNGSDKRYASIHLTWRGTELITEIFPKHLKDLIKVFKILDPDQLDQLALVCRRLGRGV